MNRPIEHCAPALANQRLNKLAVYLIVLYLGQLSTPSFAYEVWMGTHLMQSSVASNTGDWNRTASWLDGININRAPHPTDPASNSDWQAIIGRVGHVTNTMTELPRSAISKDPTIVDSDAFSAMDNRLAATFQEARNYHYEIDHLMFYNNRVSFEGTENVLSWTATEAQHMRDWLDTNGHSDVSLIWNARNYSVANQNWAKSSLVDKVMIEAPADALLNNTNRQITLLEDVWTNTATANKEVILQIPRSLNSMTQYEATRRVAVKLGQVLGYHENGIQSDRLVFLPVTYQDHVDYLPEMSVGGTSYTDSLTSLSLSLIEQRDLFEGRSGIPTNADADSLVRTPMKTLVSASSDGSLRYNKGTEEVNGPGLNFVIDADNLEVGQTGRSIDPYDRAAVMPFQLPDLGAIDNPFMFASFQAHLIQTATDENVGGDLYGIARRDSPDILHSDYFGQSDTPDENAIRLQDDILVDDMLVDMSFFSSAVGNANLLDFLNQQYAGGEGIGDYVFLRLNVDGNTEQRWAIASSNATIESQRPQLLYRAISVASVPEPSTMVLLAVVVASVAACRRKHADRTDTSRPTPPPSSPPGEPRFARHFYL